MGHAFHERKAKIAKTDKVLKGACKHSLDEECIISAWRVYLHVCIYVRLWVYLCACVH